MEIEKLNLIPNGFKQTCYCSQGDNGRIIRFELFEGITPYTLDGSETITLKISKPNGEDITASVTNTELDYVDAVINSDMTELAGVAYGELTITKDGAVIGSQNFNLEIEADAYGSDVETRTATGVIATFTTNIIDTLFIEADIEPKQDLNGYDSPFIDSNEVNKVPYLKRAVNGTASRIGNKLYDKLVGGSFAFNQMINNGNFANNTIWLAVRCTLTASNNVGTITKTEANSYIEERFNFTAGHKYLYIASLKPAENATLRLEAFYDNEAHTKGISYTESAWATLSFIIAPTATDTGDKGRFRIGLPAGDTGEVKNCNLIDLTQMLGATVADYIYSLEQATAGAGVAFFKALGFNEDYYPYNLGELMSVKATAHITRDANNNVIGNYALDSNLELRGLLKLDENNSPYYDGDIYESSGAVTRKYGIVDLGSLTWAKDTRGYMRANCNNLKYVSDAYTPNIITVPYKTVRPIQVFNLEVDKAITTSSGYSQFWAYDSTYTDATAFKTAMNGVLAIFELLTPTTEQATAFTNPQNVIAGGYEEYSDSRAVPIPVGHETYHANICEISGATECNIIRTGKNLIDLSSLITTGITYANGVLTGSAGSFDTAYSNGFNAPTKFLANTQYALSLKARTDANASTAGNGLQIGFIYTDDTKSFVRYANTDTTLLEKTLISTAGKTVKDLFISYGSASANNWFITEMQLELDSEATSFEAYKGTEVTIDLDGTIYGGKVDTNGLLTVTRKSILLDGSQAIQAGSNNRFYVNVAEARLIDANNQTTDISVFSEGFAPTTWADLQGANGNKHCSAVWGHGVAFRDDTLTTVQAWTNFFTGSPLRFTYALAEPFTVQLTGATIEALLGVNNVSADTGAVKVDYLYQA